MSQCLWWPLPLSSCRMTLLNHWFSHYWTRMSLPPLNFLVALVPHYYYITISLGEHNSLLGFSFFTWCICISIHFLISFIPLSSICQGKSCISEKIILSSYLQELPSQSLCPTPWILIRVKAPMLRMSPHKRTLAYPFLYSSPSSPSTLKIQFQGYFSGSCSPHLLFLIVLWLYNIFTSFWGLLIPQVDYTGIQP